MAIRYAVANGNWSNPATWNGGTLPTSADDVFANNFTVTIDQNITVLTLRNAANTTPAITAGGYFSIISSVTVTCSNEMISAHIWQNASSGYLIQTSGTNKIINLNINMTAIISGSTNFRYISINHTGILNYNGNIRGSINGIAMLLITSTLTVNYVGNISHFNNSTGSVGAVHIFNNATLNITGDVFCENTTQQQPASFALGVSSICTINIVGNVYNLGTSTTIAPVAIAIGAGATLNITGNITGGSPTTSTVAISSTAASYINHIGILTGGNANSTGTGAPAIVSTNGSSITIVSGPLVFGNYGAPPFQCARLFLSNNISKYVEFASNSTNGALFPNPAPTRMTMYSPNTIADSPIPANVRQGTVYALGTQTGTLIVPSPSNVRKDIPTDNTVGTADLTAADMWDYLASNITTAGSIGEVVKDIKEKTDLIPNNPTSNESVGAIVASYNV